MRLVQVSAAAVLLVLAPLWIAGGARLAANQTAAPTPAKPAVRRPAAPVAPRTVATPVVPAPKPAPEGLTNEDVVKMVKAGLSDDVVIGAIESAPKKILDLSPTGLVGLKTNGVSDRVILVMQGRQRVDPPPTPVTAALSEPVADTPPVATTTVRDESKKDDVQKRGGNPFRRLAGKIGIGWTDGGDTGTAATGSAATGRTTKLADGEPAVIQTHQSQILATATVKRYFDSKNVDYTVTPDTGRIISEWFDERRCGPGFYRCANRAVVRIASEGGQTVVRVQVIERKREGGVSEKPWAESSKSKGKQTAELSAELETLLASTTTQPSK
jgi:hypothetical protein